MPEPSSKPTLRDSVVALDEANAAKDQEIAGLKAHIAELEAARKSGGNQHELERMNIALRSEIEDLRAAPKTDKGKESPEAALRELLKNKGPHEIIHYMLTILPRYQLETVSRELAKIIAEERHLPYYPKRPKAKAKAIAQQHHGQGGDRLVWKLNRKRSLDNYPAFQADGYLVRPGKDILSGKISYTIVRGNQPEIPIGIIGRAPILSKRQKHWQNKIGARTKNGTRAHAALSPDEHHRRARLIRGRRSG